MHTFIKSLIITLFFSNPLFAQTTVKPLPPARIYAVAPTTSKIKIDGNLGESAWENATEIDLPYEWLPGDNLPAPVKTKCYLTFDKKNLYVAFRCYDQQPQKIRAHLMDRDAINTFVQDDHVTILIDPFNDERRAFQFRVNPLGVQMDANFSELEGYEDFSWDAIWNSAGKIKSWGYSVEIAIPFNQLRFPHTQKMMTWGFSAERSYPRLVRHRIRSHPTDRNKNSILNQVNKITGLAGISPGKNLEFDPTMTVMRTDRQNQFSEGKIMNGKFKSEPGLTARWGITPNMIINATANPDFSQVEADAAQLDINTRFALRYPEKRPFFLESADFFLTPLEAVFTRTVYNPIWGTKFTAKAGKNAVGFFATEDRTNNLILPANQSSQNASLEKHVNTAVLRFRRDIGHGSTIGGLATLRTGRKYYNSIAGADGFLRLTKTKILTFQYLYSDTKYPRTISHTFMQPVTPFKGSAAFVSLFHNSRNFTYRFEYENLSNHFRADAGFIPRVNYRKYRGQISPTLWGKREDWFDRLIFTLFGEYITNLSGKVTDQSVQLRFTYQGPMQSVFLAGLINNKEYFAGTTYNLQRFQAYLNGKPTGGLNLSLFGRIGDYIDYANRRLAFSLLLNPGIEWGIGKHLNINLNYILEHLTLHGEKIYTVNLPQAKFVYNFNVRSLFRAILQYTSVDRNPQIYLFPVNAASNRFFTQFLFSYKINPQTVLFIGYSDNYSGNLKLDLLQTNRTFFFKMGYAYMQ